MELPRARDLPRLVKVRQLFPSSRLEDIGSEVRARLGALHLQDRVHAGMRVGVTVGSRGAGGTLEALRAVVQELRSLGAEPFLIPAMGSHGGATPEGQVEILRRLGITEESAGAPIDPRMETVVLGEAPNGYEAHYAVSAHEADAVVVLGRTTVHPNLKAGERSDGVASGLLKMVGVGLGKQAGAFSAHHHGLGESVLAVQEVTLPRSNVIAGVSIVENAYREPAHVEVVRPEEFKACDQRQLRLARTLVGRIPFDDLDLLVCSQMGKDVAGSGLDPNVIGFWRIEGGPRVPNFRRIVSLDLTDASLGNAIGLGLNDFVPRRLVEKMDAHNTWMNLLTGANKDGSTLEGYTPIVAENDREAIELALASVMPYKAPRVCHVRDTSRLYELLISEALLPEAYQLANVEIVSEPRPYRFDDEGRFIWPE